MRTSALFSDAMSILWGDAPDDGSKEAVAIASYVKNHRINTENACEVLRIMWPGATVSVRREGDQPGGEAEVWLDVQFEDRSQVLIICQRGIGDGVEVVS